MYIKSIALYNWNNGVAMIGVFAFVCAVLIVLLLKFIMVNGKK